MLLLAGLMGIVGVGAASFAVVQLQENADEDDVPPDELPDPEESGDLLDQLTGLDDAGIAGTNASDVLAGTDAGEAITGEQGDDQIGGYGGNDLLFGGQGHALIRAGDGNDLVFSEFEDDMLHGETGLDTLHGGDGNDVLNVIVRAPFGGGTIDHDEGDLLNGGTGGHTVIVGNDDIDNTGHGADQIMLGDWIMEGHPSEVLDYTAGKDSLMLVWDDLEEGTTEPEVEVASDPYDSEVMHIVMNGRSVAEIYGDANLTVQDVTLIPLSSALIVGLEPA